MTPPRLLTCNVLTPLGPRIVELAITLKPTRRDIPRVTAIADEIRIASRARR